MRTLFALLIVIALSVSLPTTLVFGQTTTTTTSTNIFQSNVDGFRVHVPNGWVVDDWDNTEPNIQQIEKSDGVVVLAVLCPQQETLPVIGGGAVCSEAAANNVLVTRYADLISRPEFAALARENKSITTNDFLAYFIVDMEVNGGFKNFRLLQNIDTVVNVIDARTSTIIGTTPAKHIVTTFQSEYGVPSDEEPVLLVLGSDGNTGHALLPVVSAPTAEGKLPPEHQQIYSSFELVQ